MNLNVKHNQCQIDKANNDKNNDQSDVIEPFDNDAVSQQGEAKNPSETSNVSKQTGNQHNIYPFELSKDYGNIQNRIFKTDKRRSQANFRITKNKEKPQELDGLRNNISDGINEKSDYEDEKKKELERLLDDFMSSRKRKKSFSRESYIDILICKLYLNIAAAEKWVNQGYILETNITSCKESSDNFEEQTDNEQLGEHSLLRNYRNGRIN
jgi:hypothetical protein